MTQPKSIKQCSIGTFDVHLLDDDRCVFLLPGGDSDKMLEQLFALPEDIARNVVLLSMQHGGGAAKFAEYERISKDPRIANLGKLRLVKGGLSK